MANTFHIYPQGCVFSTLADIQNKHITVMGLGLNGGGEACVRFFLQHGAFVTVTDMKTAEQLKPTIDSLSKDSALDKSRLTYVLGQHREQDFSSADCVIKNPGVKIEGNKYLALAKAIETDLSIFLHFTKAPIIAVTGSKGKSSTVSAIDFGLRQAGFNSFLGGNITVSPLTFLDKTDGTTPVVLELSSWQLSDLRGRKLLKPKIAIITKIVPDHQNWYGDMDSYVADKRLIYADQTAEDFTIVDADKDGYMNESATPKQGCSCWGDLFASETKATVLRYSKKMLSKEMYGVWQQKDKDGILVGIEKLPANLMSNHAQKHEVLQERIMGSLCVPGDHMKTNVLNAALTLRLMGVSPEQAISILSSWKGIPHRLELFHSWVTGKQGSHASPRKVLFYNDSCATVPEAAAAASQSFDKRVVFITGGTDKGLSVLPLAKTLAGENSTLYPPKEIYLLAGSCTDKLVMELDARHVKYVGPFDSLEILLGVLKANLLASDAEKVYGIPIDSDPLIVVFSPGATSFGMFTNEFDRGDTFKTEVKNIFE